MKKFFAFLESIIEANKLRCLRRVRLWRGPDQVKGPGNVRRNLTRENVMKQGGEPEELCGPTPRGRALRSNTSATDFAPIRAASDAAVQGQEMGAVRRHHSGETQQLGLARVPSQCFD